ncbi:hypothetical protein MTR67_052222 [Solanum verrucosum]|nr:hypothetical protein MTR67_052222 [Solanum verrucosum]
MIVEVQAQHMCKSTS